MKILLLGRNGQVGWELQRSLALLGEVVALGTHATANPERLCGDFKDAEGLAQTVRRVAPGVIVNAAAYTAVDKAESEPALAHQINAVAPGVLAAEAAKLGALLVHYSTDYVFDGGGDKPWRETDPTGPCNVYGQTKLEGERAVALCARHLIFRTSWVYAARGGNFAKTMARLAMQRPSLRVIDDQWGAPTGADLLADVTALALHGGLASGTYHVAAAGYTNWFAYATQVLDLLKAHGAAENVVAQHIEPVPSSAFPTPARRPHNSRLDTRKLEHALGVRMPPWQEGVARMLAEINYAP